MAINSKYFHLAIIPVFPALFLLIHSSYLDENGLLAYLVTFVCVAGFSFLLFVLLSCVLKNKPVAAAITSVSMLWFLSYYYLYSILQNIFINGIQIGRDRYLLPMYVGIFIAILVVLLRLKNGHNKTINIVLNNAAIAILIFSAVQGVFKFKSKQSHTISRTTDIPSLVPKAKRESGPKPDIFFIILDSYTSNNALKANFEFDNSDFLHKLNMKGFYIAENSTSNYPITHLSIPSLLNGRYMKNNPKTDTEQYSEYLKFILLHHHDALQPFTENGYDVYKIGPYWKSDKTEISSQVSQVRHILAVLLKKSVSKPYFDLFCGITEQRRLITKTFQSVYEVAQKKEHPKVVVAHILCPHPPFAFESNGSRPSVLKTIVNGESKVTRYIKQLRYINNSALALVDTILATSKLEPIIIFQGDHGASFINSSVMDSRVFPNTRFIQHQFSILNAYKVPDSIRGLLYPTITPVNSFRVIANGLFSQSDLLLPDKNYYASHASPFDHKEVTDIVQHIEN